MPLYATAVGKTFLSRMSEPELNAYLERTRLTLNTPYTRIEPGKIIEELNQLRLQGYALDNEEMEEGDGVWRLSSTITAVNPRQPFQFPAPPCVLRPPGWRIMES